jgi:hypothetical protein
LLSLFVSFLPCTLLPFSLFLSSLLLFFPFIFNIQQKLGPAAACGPVVGEQIWTANESERMCPWRAPMWQMFLLMASYSAVGKSVEDAAWHLMTSSPVFNTCRVFSDIITLSHPQKEQERNYHLLVFSVWSA